MTAPATGRTALEWAGGTRVLAADRAVPWVRRAVDSDGTLYRHASGHAVLTRHGGRGEVYGLEAGGEIWMVRHYRRGGAFGNLLEDRYARVRTPRPLREVRVSDALRAAGVRTPEVVAAAVYPEGPIYRADLVTAYVPGTATLAEALAGGTAPDGADPARALTRTGALIRTLAEAGAYHVDLNAGNVLVPAVVADPAWVVDLDRCRVGVDRPDRSVARMIARLARSLAKLRPASGVGAPAEWIDAVREGAA